MRLTIQLNLESNEEVRVMGTEWINRIVREKAERMDSEKRAIAMERLAERDCGALYSALVTQMEKDVNAFRHASDGRSVFIKQDRNTGVFEVRPEVVKDFETPAGIIY